MSNSGWLKAALSGAGVYLLLQILGLIPCVGCLLFPVFCIAWFALPIGVGVLSIIFSKDEKEGLENAAMTSLKAGAVYAILAFVIMIIFQLISLVLSSVFNISFSALESLGSNGEYADSLAFLPFATMTGIGFALICGALGFLKDLFLVVLGGIITAAIKEK